MAFAGGVAVLLVLAALLVPTVGGLNSDRGSSTCALIYISIRKNVFARGNTQFLIPISSSTRPSYVSCVKSGVIISTRRSKTINESILDEDDKSGSEDDPFAALGV